MKLSELISRLSAVAARMPESHDPIVLIDGTKIAMEAVDRFKESGDEADCEWWELTLETDNVNGSEPGVGFHLVPTECVMS